MLFNEVTQLIKELRRKNSPQKNWEAFRLLISENIKEICSNFDSRWLVSIADTYIDYGNDVERRNAAIVSLICNMEKMWATNLLMHDVKINEDKLQMLKKNRTVPLWDGMYSMNINKGEMPNNLFYRISNLMVETPEIKLVYETVISRLLKDENTTLGNLSKYHKNLLSPAPKRSILYILFRKIRQKARQYKLIF